MHARFLLLHAAVSALALTACSSSDSSEGAGAAAAASSGAAGPSGSGAQGGTGAGPGAGGGTSASTGSGAGGGVGGAAGAPTASELLALTGSCTEVSTSDYKSDDEGSAPADIPVCGLTGAVFWSADMDVDCDGKQTAECNLGTDPAYQNQTSATDSNGDPLDAAALPFVVVPLPSARFDYSAAGLSLGSVIAVVYGGKVAYGVFGDEGPDNIIGEASYAMAALLGVDPDPSTGGTDGPVVYIAFTGGGAVAAPIEDHAAATELGESLAAKLVDRN
jgi:hypothetical protein